jgi:two-component system sensor histidine kinase YesM
MIGGIKRAMQFKSFRSKLMMASIACILLPAILTLSIYNYLTEDAVKNQAISNSEQTLQLVNGNVSSLLKDMLYLVNYIKFDTEARPILKEMNAGAAERETVNYQEFSTEHALHKKIIYLAEAGEKRSYITILLPNGRYFANYGVHEYDPRLFFEEPWFDKVKDFYGYQSYWVDTAETVFSEDKGKSPYQLTVIHPLREVNSEIYAYVAVTIMENEIHKHFENLTGDQEVMLLDQNDRILSHVDPSMIGKTVPYLKEAAMKGKSDVIQIDNQDYLLSRQNVLNDGWKLLSLTPYKQAVFSINSIFERVFLLQLISFIVFFILLMFLLRAFTSPLVKLDKVASSVQSGNLEVRSLIRGNDEIGRLGKSFDQMLDRIIEMISEITRSQARKRKAELAMLQAQINPHFLFNVLNSIRMKVLGKGDREGADMISSLSKLLRMTISQEKGDIPLHEEVQIVMDYMLLMNMRQKEKVDFEVDISSDVFLERVPRFFLQPIIENALIHGLSQQAGTVSLKAYVEADQIVLRIQDSGQGMDEPALERIRSQIEKDAAEIIPDPETKKGFSSIGLANVCERMRLTFGDSFHMEVDSGVGMGTRVTMYIPRQEENAHV